MPELSATLQDLTRILAEIPGDALLRCTEGVEGGDGEEPMELIVHSEILRLASPVLRDALELEKLDKGKIPTLQVRGGYAVILSGTSR